MPSGLSGPGPITGSRSSPFSLMLLTDGDRHAPGGVLLAPYDLGDALGSTPADLADPDGVGENHRALAGLRRWVIEDAHRRDVDDDARVRGLWQDELRRYDNLAIDARQPGIDLRIGAHDLLVADVEAPRDVGERIVRPDLGDLHHAHDVLSGCELEALVGHRQRQGRRCGWRRRRWWRRRVPEGAEQRAGREQHAGKARERSAGGSKLHGQTIMTDVAQRRMSSMRYRSTGWCGSSLPLAALPGKCRPRSAPTPRMPTIEPS